VGDYLTSIMTQVERKIFACYILNISIVISIFEPKILLSTGISLQVGTLAHTISRVLYFESAYEHYITKYKMV